MTNISITSRCNRSCVYCFAKDAGTDRVDMAYATFEQALDYLHRSGITTVRLLGGEPTIHPDFPLFIDLIEKRGFDLLLFSNGNIPQASLDRLCRFPRQRLHFLLNTHPPHLLQTNEKSRFLSVCNTFGPRITLGCNIYSPMVELEFIPALIEKFALMPEIRLGLAHPCIGGDNVFLHPRYYRQVGLQIGSFARKVKSSGIRVELDCGFVPCMFTDEDFALLTVDGEVPGTRCNPLPDLLPDGQFIPCYPLMRGAGLAGRKNSLSSTVQEKLQKQTAVYRKAGIYSRCNVCKWRDEGECSGGCLAAAMKRQRHIPFAVHVDDQPKTGAVQVTISSESNGVRVQPVPEGGEKSAKAETWTIPYIDQPISFWEEVHARFASLVQSVYFPLTDADIPTGRPRQKAEHLGVFLKKAQLPVSLLINPPLLSQPVDEIAPLIIKQIHRLQNETDLHSVTVADFLLGQRIREKLPDISLTASVLMEISEPQQAMLLNTIFDTLVPASRVVRNYQQLQALKKAFNGQITLLVNEACLTGCLFRTQHFYEMAYLEGEPRSLCSQVLKEKPWLRLTGAWILPQHLAYFSEIADGFKLAGRVTLSNQHTYLSVLESYISRKEISANEIGGGPASVLDDIPISDAFFKKTLECSKDCHECTYCMEYYDTFKLKEM